MAISNLLEGCAETGPQQSVARSQEAPAPVSASIAALQSGRIAVMRMSCESGALLDGFREDDSRIANDGGAGAADFGALVGALQGALTPLYVAGALGPLVIFILPAIPVAMAAGAVVGAAMGHESTPQRAPTDIPAVRSKSPLRESIDELLLTARADELFVRELAATRVGSAVYKFELREPSCTEPGSHDALKAEGFDALLQVRVTELGFTPWRTQTPQAAFVMTVEGRLELLNSHAIPALWSFSRRGLEKTRVKWAYDG